MSKGIDLSKYPPADTCGPCAKTGIKVESYKVPVQSSQAVLDLIYSGVLGPFIESYDGAKYFVTFLDNWDKLSDIILLAGKSEVLAIFQLFQ